VVTFGDAHWAKLIRPQRWAGVRACPPRRQGKASSYLPSIHNVIQSADDDDEGQINFSVALSPKTTRTCNNKLPITIHII